MPLERRHQHKHRAKRAQVGLRLLFRAARPIGYSSARAFLGRVMIFEQVATGGCQSYLLGCDEALSAILIDPHLNQIDRYLGLAAKDGLRIRYVLDTHTHADHFSAAKELGKSLDVPVVTSKLSPAPYAGFKLDDGEILRVGGMRLKALHTPGHTRDSMCVLTED